MNFIESICIFSYDAWEIGLKKYPQSVHFHKIWGSENDKVKVEKVKKINLNIISKSTCTSADPGENMCKVSKRPVQNCMRSCNHKVSTVYTSEVKKWQSSKSTKKWQKIWQGLYEKHMHIFRLWRKHEQSSKKISIKLYEELCLRGTHCLYIEGEKWLSSQCGKSDKK